MGCATATIKYLVFIFNTLCALLGIAVITINAIALKNVDAEAHTLCIILIVIGAIAFVISFFGCCGAIKENVCLTWTYATVLLLLLVAGCVLVFVYLQRINFHNRAELELNTAWKKQVNGTDAMDFYQKNLHCCGVNSTQDYSKANLKIPQSCYQTNSTTATYPDGCLTALTNFYENAVHLVKIVSYATIGVEGVAFLAACILAISFGNQERRSRY